jgi:hypothetical protein
MNEINESRNVINVWAKCVNEINELKVLIKALAKCIS